MLNISAYTEAGVLRTDVAASEIPALLADPHVRLWVDMEAPTEEERALLAGVFHFHPLAVEDCIAETHLPKLDDYGEYLFLVVHHGARSPETPGTFATVELNLFLGPRYLVTYHDEPSRTITEVLRRLRKNSPTLARGVDWMLHEILDGVIHNYLPILDDIDEQIAVLERRVLEDPDHGVLSQILSLKRDVMHLKRVAAPQREILHRLSRDPLAVIDARAQVYFRDVYDDLVRIADLAEGYREHLTATLEAHLSMVSNRLNAVMKVLTVIATIFMPLTLIAGIYGMNFAWMPELRWQYGYLYALGLMGAIAAVMLYLFKRKGWF
ncbi:MAG: magnesium/cobalt transporter CorA [Nitrospirae bacterium]|nr:magnesium/cobalt transporter CorA [Nitrospirota bacterium]